MRVTDVSKHFRLYDDPITGPLRELLTFGRGTPRYRRHTAVRNVSLTVRRGETVGIVGLNGSGKTTLLKMIAGLLPVDEGHIHVNGRITALLALGVGVHAEMSGRDNVRYGGMLLGMTAAEVEQKLPSIVEFAELEDFIDHPFRTYSSGMKARLLFSISMAIDPDILIVDEALATGDTAFVEKSSARVRELCRSGATVIFVSHNLRQVEDLCDRTIVMRGGSVVFDGPTSTAIGHYIEGVHEERAAEIARRNAVGHSERAHSGTGEMTITDVHVRVRGQRTETVIIGERAEIVIEFLATMSLPLVRFFVELRSEKSPVTYAFLPPGNRQTSDAPWATVFPVAQGRGSLVVEIETGTLGDGHYSCDVEFFDGHEGFRFAYDRCYAYLRRAVGFQAIYRGADQFGRGTLAEVMISGIRLEQPVGEGIDALAPRV